MTRRCKGRGMVGVSLGLVLGLAFGPVVLVWVRIG